MKKASSSLFVLVLFAAMVSQVNAQTQQGQQGGGAQGSFDPNYGSQGSAQGGHGQQGSAQGGHGQQGSAQGGHGQQGSAQGGYSQQGSAQGGYAQGGYGQQGSAQGGYGQGGYAGGYSQSRVISQRVSQQLRMREVRRVSEILRLSMGESIQLEASSITISAAALRNQAILEISSRGRLISSQIIRRQLDSVTILLPAMSRLDDLEISASDDLMLDTITVLVEESRGHRQDMQPMSGQLIKLDVRQDIRMSGSIDLKQLVQQQLGLTLEGAQIERIGIEAQVLRGRSASVQVEMNYRMQGQIKMISDAQRMTPILLNSLEDVRGSLRLQIRGDLVITQIVIRVGQVRRLW